MKIELDKVQTTFLIDLLALHLDGLSQWDNKNEELQFEMDLTRSLMGNIQKQSGGRLWKR